MTATERRLRGISTLRGADTVLRAMALALALELPETLFVARRTRCRDDTPAFDRVFPRRGPVVDDQCDPVVRRGG
jgi:hypothetical protein